MQKFVNTMTMFATVLAVCILYCTAAQNSKEIYTMDINERGSQFKESIEVDSKEETVVYNVPEHNNLTESHVLVDYKTSISVTLVPKLKECYVRKLLSKNKEPSLSEIRRNMQLQEIVAEKNVSIPVEIETDVMIKIREIQSGMLSLKVLKFCAGNRVYLVKDVPLKQILAQNTTKEGSHLQKRTGPERRFRFRLLSVTRNQANRLLQNSIQGGVYTCKAITKYDSVISECVNQGKDIRYGCGPRPLSCRYAAYCKPVFNTGTDKPGGEPPSLKSGIVYVEIECKEQHRFTVVWCCDIICV